MIQLSQLNLQFPFGTLGSLGENVEDQAGTINNPALQDALKIALLRWGQSMIENDQIGTVRSHFGTNFLDFAFTRKGCRVGASPLALHLRTDCCPSRGNEQAHLFQAVGDIPFTEIELHDNRALSGRWAFKHKNESCRPDQAACTENQRGL